MKSFAIIKSRLSQCFYIYSVTGRLIARCESLAQVSQYIRKVQEKMQLRTVVYTNTCCEDVVLVTLK